MPHTLNVIIINNNDFPQVGTPVQVLFSTGGSKTGLVQFTGTTDFAGGNWVGVALDTADG